MTTTVAENANGMTRREFLYYIWTASVALFLAESTGLFVWFALPRFREGEFGGLIPVALDEIPPENDPPVDRSDGRFWLVNLNSSQPDADGRMSQASDEATAIQGVVAIYKVCTHLGCIYAWNAANHRFECPCHGSKYRLDGRRIEDPAPRTLDRFKVIAVDENEEVLAESEKDKDEDDFYKPLMIPAGTAKLFVDTGDKKQGPIQQLLCDFTGNCP